MLSLLIKIFGAIIVVLLALWILYKFFLNHYISRLPLKRMGFKNAPAYPLKVIRMLKTLLKLNGRATATRQAKFGLIEKYTIKGFVANAYAFCYSKNFEERRKKAILGLRRKLMLSPLFLFQNATLVKYILKEGDQQGTRTQAEIDETTRFIDTDEDGIRDQKVDLTTLPLDSPDQFSISWTTFGNVQRRASKDLLPIWTKSLEDPEEATNQFFPTLSKYGVAYNLLVLKKLNHENVADYERDFPIVWSNEMKEALKNQQLFIIDFRIFKAIKPHKGNESDPIWRYTPASFMWLKQDKKTKELRPFAIHIEGNDYPDLGIKNESQFYTYADHKDTTWVYAIQAVKVSMTVFGIWLGHVYPWHLVTGAMAMTLFNYVKKDKSIYQLLAPQSNHLIGFNNALFFLWKSVAPPTSLTAAHEFLALVDQYAINRNFLDDDPKKILDKADILVEDFTVNENWDKYPMVGYMLEVWNIVEKYVEGYIKISYKTDEAVVNDKYLQKWITKSTTKGNIKGLPTMNSVDALREVLTSYLYRITVHGLSRIDNTANPAMSFVGNFPPCLQNTNIPSPETTINTEALMDYLPRTGTIGGMLNFYFTFADSAPYESLIPEDGIDQHLLFSNTGRQKTNKNLNASGHDRDTGEAQALNRVLLEFRKEMRAFMIKYNQASSIPDLPPNSVQLHQWPLCVET